MMQTKIIIGVIIGIVVIAGGYFLLGNNVEVPTTDDSVVAETKDKKMAFADFIKQGGSYKCTVHQSVQGIDTQGVTYIDGDMIRGEYTTNTQGMTIDTTMIVRDGYSYSWSSLAPMGYKVKLVESTSANTDVEMSGSYSFNAEDIGEYECEAWSANASMFTIPNGVTFQEI